MSCLDILDTLNRNGETFPHLPTPVIKELFGFLFAHKLYLYPTFAVVDILVRDEGVFDVGIFIKISLTLDVFAILHAEDMVPRSCRVQTFHQEC